MKRIEKDGHIVTDYRLGKSVEYYKSTSYQWIPAQVRRGDLVRNILTPFFRKVKTALSMPV